jgi:AAHS family 4-hydroxybenzoate transporter-like MFS transporter
MNIATTPTVIDVPRAIDAHPVGRFQIQLLIVCALVLLADGFDTQAISFVVPGLVRDFGVSRAQVGPVLSAGLFGLMLGALFISPLADRVGRRRIIITSTILFGGFTIATAYAQDLNQMLVFRALTGLGLGGAMPNAIALIAEFSPQRRRTVMVMTMFCGFSLGGVVSGALAAWLIPAYGWRAVFVVGGLFPLLFAPFLLIWLPESVRFLALAGGEDLRVGRLLARIGPALRHPAGTRFIIAEPRPSGLPVLQLFAGGRMLATAVLWVVFFMSLLDLYFLALWIPTVVNAMGASVSLAALAGGLLQLGGITGSLVLGWLIQRFGSAPVLATSYAVATVSIAALGSLGFSIPAVMVAIFGAGFGVVGAQIGANAYAASFYPTAYRATGVGWALGIGRIGSILGPLIGGILLSQNFSTATIFLYGAIPAGIAVLCWIILGVLEKRAA